MSEALIVFKAVNEDFEKEQILQKIVQNKDSIYLQDSEGRPLVLKPKSVEADLHLYCHPLEQLTRVKVGASRLTANVNAGGESYIFDTLPVVETDQIKLPVFNLFHLQKRKNFRYTLPEGYGAEFVFNTLNNTENSLHCRLLDLSTDGCAIEIPLEQADLKLQDKLEGAIFLGQRNPIVVQGFIKNIRAKGDSHLVLGVEFNHLPNSSEGLIVASLADLQREVYFRRAA